MEKRICGVAYKGSETILVVIDSKGCHESNPVRKVPLQGDSPEQLKQFKSVFESFARDAQIDLFVVRQPALKGQQKAGAPTIRMDTLVRLAEGDFTMETLAPQTVAAKLKKNPQARPSSVLAYQEDAYFVARARSF
jgi:Protein of unknown function (DUF3010)